MYNKYLPIFIKVADCGSFTKAASELYISPNALIKQINLLEEHLEIKLFDRTNHGVFLTEPGKILYQNSKFLINYSKKTIEQAKDLVSSKEETIYIGTSILNPIGSNISLFKSLKKALPNFKTEIISFDDKHHNLIHTIDNFGENIDLYFGLYPSSKYENRCNTLHLKDYPLSCAMSINHRLALKDSISLEDLHGEKVMMIQKGDTIYIDNLRKVIEEKHPEIELIDVPLYDIHTFNQCEKMNIIMISAEIWQHVHPLLVTIPIKTNHFVPYGIVYSLNPPKKVNDFISAIKELTKE